MIQCKLKELLARKGLAQSWLATQIGVSRQHINNIARGRRALGLGRLDDFCRLLKCQPGDLLVYKEDKEDD